MAIMNKWAITVVLYIINIIIVGFTIVYDISALFAIFATVFCLLLVFLAHNGVDNGNR
jgi:hypothetical protein